MYIYWLFNVKCTSLEMHWSHSKHHQLILEFRGKNKPEMNSTSLACSVKCFGCVCTMSCWRRPAICSRKKSPKQTNKTWRSSKFWFFLERLQISWTKAWVHLLLVGSEVWMQKSRKDSFFVPEDLGLFEKMQKPSFLPRISRSTWLLTHSLHFYTYI